MAAERRMLAVAERLKRLTGSEHRAVKLFGALLLALALAALVLVTLLERNRGANAHAPHAGIDFYIAIDSPQIAVPTAAMDYLTATPVPKGNNLCDTDDSTQSIPTTCTLSPNDTFTVKVYLKSYGDLTDDTFGYEGFNVRLDYSGVTFNGTLSAAPWPECAIPASIIVPGVVRWGCSIIVSGSFYLGLMGTADFTCSASGSVTMVHGVDWTNVAKDIPSGPTHAEGDTVYNPSTTRTPNPTPTFVGNPSESLSIAGCDAPTATSTVPPTATATATATATNTPTHTPTFTPTDTPTNTPTFTPLTPSATPTACPTSGCATATSTATFTPTYTPTRTGTATFTATATATATNTSPPTSTPTPTFTSTATTPATATNTAPATSTATPSATPSNTPTRTNTSPPPGTATATVPPVVPGVADLTVTKVESQDPIVAARPILYTIRVRNIGGAVANFVRLRDTPDSSFTYTGFSTSQGSCAIVGPVTGGILDCDLGSLENGGAGVFIFVTGHYATLGDRDVKNVATIDPDNTVPESNESNNSASAGTRLMVDTPTPGNPSPTLRPPSATEPFTQGDVNGDGHIDSLDALLVLLFEAGLRDDLPVLAAADVDKNGMINVTDALLILQIDAGL